MIRNLLTTTALVTALLAGGAFAQDATAPAATNTAGPSDLLNQGYDIIDTDGLASKLIGFPVYTSAAADAERLGEINDIVLNQEGQVAAVILGVGGFLGVGEKNVAVAYTDLDWVQAEDDSERIVLETTKEALNAAPAVELVDDEPMDTAAATPAPAENAPAADQPAGNEAMETAAANDAADAPADADADATDDTAVAQAPATDADADGTDDNLETGAIANQPATEPGAATTMEPLDRQGLVDFDELTLTAEDLIGTNVYGPNDEHIGVIGDFVFGEDGKAIDAVIIDFGGFLGIGTKEVAVAFDNLNFLADEQGGNRALVLNVTREQMEQAVAFNRDTYPAERETQRLTVSAL
jgi:sporulation protein YlmC with PRC-barrel domain